MKLTKLFGLLFFASIGANAATPLNNIVVDQLQVHEANPAMGVGASGKVSYSFNAGDNDSVFVTVTIVPAAGGGAALPLKSVTGDVGVVNVVKQNTAENHSIFFELAGDPVAGTQYFAHLKIDAVVSKKMQNVNQILGSLSKSQMAGICGDELEFQSKGVEGIVPPIYMNDGPYGWNYGWGKLDYHATCYPSTINLGCTWDTALAHFQGWNLAEEWLGKTWHDKKRNCHLGPGMNIIYHPRGGRSAEYFAEDPYLSGHMAAAEVRGVQSKGVIATIKHFAVNNIENNRSISNSYVPDERTIQEIFLANFKPAARVAWALMTSYNRINGEWAGSSKYNITDVLRNTWGFKSYVVSDWGAAYDPTKAIKYGQDLGANWQGPFDNGYTGPMNAANDDDVKAHATRILWAHQLLGDMVQGYDPDPTGKYANMIEGPEHKAAGRFVGTRSIVLARNDPAPTKPILPLPKTKMKIAVVSGTNGTFGEFASKIQRGIIGSSNVYPSEGNFVTYLDGLTRYLTDLNVGSEIITNPTTAQLSAADYILAFVGSTGESENKDRSSSALGSSEGESAVGPALASANGLNKTIIVYSGGNSSTPGKWSRAKAILVVHFPGDQQGLSLADVLFGDYNPSAKLTTTFYNNPASLPPYISNNTVTYPSSDSAHGYFRLDKLKDTALFAFGHGLSYTTFDYSGLQIFPKKIKAGDRVHVQVTVTNKGTNPAGTPDVSKEVVELYLSMPSSASLPTRVQDLRGFQAVQLAKYESKTISFELTPEEMQVYQPTGNYDALGQWIVQTGTYKVRLGTSANPKEKPSVDATFDVN
jgi:beta-glucosidase